MGKHLTPDERQQVADQFEDGHTVSGLAERWNITAQTVRKILRALAPDEYAERRYERTSPPAQLTRKHVERRDQLFLYAKQHPEMTLQQIGDEWGVTRERVRQLLVKIDPEYYKQRKQMRRSMTKRAQRQAEQIAKRQGMKCRVCGKQIPPPHTTYCSSEHRNYYLTYLRYHVDNETRERQRKATSRWVLENLDTFPENERESKRMYAERELAGEANRRGRWMTAQGRTIEIALEAYEKAWPIFKELPEGVRKQVVDLHNSWEDEGWT